MTTRVARCACGGLTISASGEPVRISICHCLECKRRTGSVFSWNAHWPGDRVAIEGDHRNYERSSDDGGWVRQHFCPTCGVMVFYAIECRPGIVSIPVGAFADPAFPAPTVEVYEDRRCAWLSPLAADHD